MLRVYNKDRFDLNLDKTAISVSLKEIENMFRIFCSLTFFCMLITVSGCGSIKSFLKKDNPAIYGSRGYKCFINTDFEGALTNYQEACKLASKKSPQLQANYWFNIGRIYYEMGKNDSALIYLRKSNKALLMYGDTAEASMSAGYIALLYVKRGLPDIAYRIYEKNNYSKNNVHEAFWLTVKARIFIQYGKYQKAVSNLKRARTIYLKANDYDGLAGNYLFFAAIPFRKQQYKESHIMLQSALDCVNKTNIKYRRWKILFDLALVSMQMGNKQIGLDYYSQAKECTPQGVTLPSLGALSKNKFLF